MKAAQYRIGNYIKFGERIINITHHDIRNLYESELINKVHSGSYKDIPLTEEWLINFGFKSLELDNFSFTKNLELRIKGDSYDYTGIWYGKIEYVHTLQNLYYYFNNKELTYESTKI